MYWRGWHSTTCDFGSARNLSTCQVEDVADVLHGQVALLLVPYVSHYQGELGVCEVQVPRAGRGQIVRSVVRLDARYQTGLG